MEGIFLLLGSNLGDRLAVLSAAIKSLEESAITVLKRSSVYETAAWGKTDQQAFLNQVIKVSSDLDPEQLLDTILAIETQIGRVRKVKWGERLIDIDILYYHDLVINKEHIQIPHPGIPSRRFTLVPLVEIASKSVHPVIKLSQYDLLNKCKDNLEVRVLEA